MNINLTQHHWNELFKELLRFYLIFLLIIIITSSSYIIKMATKVDKILKLKNIFCINNKIYM